MNNKGEGAHSLSVGAPLYFCRKFVIVMNEPFFIAREMQGGQRSIDFGAGAGGE
ncbi:hypothetical protein [Parageobacillus thermoglucosidasius]|jgi:hypothetical protein|uniref:hypothetical protein n=1 Tax=Parageobacillus thermoglucosidasius TaxID=1426 RepID=UPI0001D17054|nr:hypothetical protein [Parageobacillus thermoglucosidasius]AEH47274.1 hypothetical protein Geoth_1281 [Parageobacillus thermoglucosidasius C56-YS93]MED4905200.1 hypothetical protein [Parageobacillus thermoglucosidasius]MED4913425.1 hypothetical protein [Parageobacillus thermoglucosidasius]MED4944536.1 hypothetical protein [Parageobacillus thermoglucosidasius]MED4984585.1 hypothetical protein [Parageobacillus thermoglucosidasius]